MSGVDTSAVTAVATAAAIGLALAGLLALGVGPSSAAIDSDTTRLSGTVTDEDGETIFAANVTVNGSSQATRTNADGFYSLELEAGEHEVTVDADGHEPKTWTENLTTGSWTRTDVTLAAAPTELEGTVTNPDDEPVEGATVRIADTDLEATTDENGSYAFEIDPGSYSLETSVEGYNTRRSSVTVKESQVTTRDVQLSDGGRSDDDADEESDADEQSETDDENDVDGESDEDGEGDSHDERSDGNENGENGDETDHDEDDTSDDDSASDERVDGDTRDDDSPPATNREQVLTVLFFAGTFLAAMITAAMVGLYRNRRR